MIRLVFLAIALAATSAGAQVAEPDDYRMGEYRAPVPDTLAGATVVDAVVAHDLWQAGRVAFVDTLPRPARPANLPEGTIWRDAPRRSIPGATWLPNVGYGALPPETEAYLDRGLRSVTGGDHAAPLLFFCLDACWQSYNTAKRALRMGYTDVRWFPGGTDLWAAAGYPLEEVLPADP